MLELRAVYDQQESRPDGEMEREGEIPSLAIIPPTLSKTDTDDRLWSLEPVLDDHWKNPGRLPGPHGRERWNRDALRRILVRLLYNKTKREQGGRVERGTNDDDSQRMRRRRF